MAAAMVVSAKSHPRTRRPRLVVRVMLIQISRQRRAPRIMPEPIVSMSLRAGWNDFPESIAVQHHLSYESRVDSILYRQVLAELGRERGWDVHLYGKDVESQGARSLGERADEVLQPPASDARAHPS